MDYVKIVWDRYSLIRSIVQSSGSIGDNNREIEITARRPEGYVVSAEVAEPADGITYFPQYNLTDGTTIDGYRQINTDEAGKKTILTDVVFSEYDPDTGELVSQGRADQAIYYGDTKDKRLEGRLDRTVTISRSDGSSVSGAGFEASSRDRSFSFRGSVEGRIEAKTEPKSAREIAK